MDNLPIKILYTKMAVLIAKVEELPGNNIGEPDCILIDPCHWDFSSVPHEHDEDGNHIGEDDPLDFTVRRFPGKMASEDTKLAFHSSNIYTILEPTQALVSEYLITISD